jgi:lipopolysaccharide/colanic/teichoic acid biosynthesis glycosyltransferase
MEPTAMLLEKKPLTRKYKHFSIPSATPVAEPDSFEFLFIGKNSLIINHLIASCESGYAAENSEKAINMLERLRRNNKLPDLIIADSVTGKEELMQIKKALTEKRFDNIPYFIDNSFGSQETNLWISNELCCDDVIEFTALSGMQIRKKVDFWKKMKSTAVESTIKENRKDFKHKSQAILKRVIDIVLSTFLMVTLSPVFLLVAIALKLESGGPCIYVSRRAGKGYRIFKFFKFRTMHCGADKNIAQVSHLNAYSILQAPNPLFLKINNDPRVTRIGNFLRKTSLDELPQLWNVLKGDMSLVGNRPLPLYEAETLTTDNWSKRFLAPAGITGLWQVNKNKMLSMSIEERLQLDIQYAEDQSLFKDFQIMAKTPTALIQKTPN